jgi:phosphogluconate dehydratase
LVTDGRMSGASGKVPAAIHVSPEALAGGAIGQIENGDMIELDANTGSLRVLVDDATLAQRQHATADLASNAHGSGRDLFGAFRRHASVAELGASAMFEDL